MYYDSADDIDKKYTYIKRNLRTRKLEQGS